MAISTQISLQGVRAVICSMIRKIKKRKNSSHTNRVCGNENFCYEITIKGDMIQVPDYPGITCDW